jgi:hypothetical protein
MADSSGYIQLEIEREKTVNFLQKSLNMVC